MRKAHPVDFKLSIEFPLFHSCWKVYIWSFLMGQGLIVRPWPLLWERTKKCNWDVVRNGRYFEICTKSFWFHIIKSNDGSQGMSSERCMFLCCSPLPQPALLQRRGSTGGEFSDIRRREATVRRPLPQPDQPIHSWRPQQPDKRVQDRAEVQTNSTVCCNIYTPLVKH